MESGVKQHRALSMGAITLIAMVGFLAMVSSARAEEPLHWVTGPAPGTELEGEESLEVAAGGPTVFKTKLFGVVDTTFEIGGLDAVGLTIANSGSGAVGSGQLTFRSIQIVGQPECTVSENATSAPLTFTAENVGGHADLKIVPTAGESSEFLRFRISGSGCPIRTLVKLSGNMTGEFANSIGVQSVDQPVYFWPSTTMHNRMQSVEVSSSDMEFSMRSGDAFGLL